MLSAENLVLCRETPSPREELRSTMRLTRELLITDFRQNLQAKVEAEMQAEKTRST